MPAEGARLAGVRGLYAITPEGLPATELLRRVDLALAGGAALVQFRAKDLPAPIALEQARALRVLCHAYAARFIVNDSVELALACDADGVHLGRDDGDVVVARAALGGRLIGVSCYDDPGLARVAASQGADYVAIGSVFASATKPGAVHAPLERIAEARLAGGLPVAAIGGIDAANARLAIAAGADMLAVIGALFDAPDVRAAARAISDCFPPSCEGSNHVRTQQATL